MLSKTAMERIMTTLDSSLPGSQPAVHSLNSLSALVGATSQDVRDVRKFVQALASTGECTLEGERVFGRAHLLAERSR